MKKDKTVYAAWTALGLSVVAIVLCLVCCLGCDKGQTTDVAAVLKEKPELVIEAMQNYEVKMREEASLRANEVVAANIDEVNNNPASPVMGNPQGEVVLVEFFDFSCGYCHKLYPAIKNILAKNPNVKFVTKELSFVAPISSYAARAAHAANKQGKYDVMYNALFTAEDRLDEVKVDEIAANAGLDMDKYKADMESAEVAAALQGNSELAQKLQINGVPTLILNGKMLQTIDEAVIQEAIDAAK